MDYFAIAIVTSWILGVTYTATSLMVAIGLKISTPTISSSLHGLVRGLFSLAFLGMGLHYIHLGYFGALHGILPSQESLVGAIANVLQVLTLIPTIVLTWYLRLKAGRRGE